MKGYGRYWRVTSIEIQGSVGVREIKGKVQVIYTSHSPQRSYHSLSPTRDRLHCTSLPTTEKPGKDKLDEID